MTQQVIAGGAIVGEVVEELPDIGNDAPMSEREVEDAVLGLFNRAVGEMFAARFLFCRGSLELDADMEKETFLVFGYLLKVVHDNIQWWAGGWYAYGEKRWGDEIVQVLDRKHKTLANWASTYRKVPEENRRADLDWSHFPIVQSLPPEKQKEVLDEAAENDYTVRQTRERVESIQQEQAEREAEERGLKVERVAAPVDCPHCNGTGKVLPWTPLAP